MMATILHVTLAHHRSDTRIFIKEARTLAHHLPHRVVLMVADGEGDTDHGLGDVFVHDIGRPSGNRFRRTVSGLWRALVAIRRIRPDVVHFHDPELLPLGLLLKVTGVRVVYDVHEDVPQLALNRQWVPRPIRVPAAWILGAIEWLGAQVFDVVVTATPKIAERFPGGKTVTVQNFPIMLEMTQRKPVPYMERPRSFAYVGGISQLRSAIEMVRAFGVLDEPDVRFELAGYFSPEDFEDTLRAEAGWRAVTYHGSVNRKQLAALLGNVRAGMVLFYPSPNHVDAQPTKMFEYMSAGLPVIASDFPLWRSIIDGVGCGLLVDPQDPEAIAGALRWMLDHSEKAEAMGQRGRWAVERTYNWDAEAVRLTGAYDALMAR